MEEIIIVDRKNNNRIGVIFFTDDASFSRFLAKFENKDFIYCSVDEYRKLNLIKNYN